MENTSQKQDNITSAENDEHILYDVSMLLSRNKSRSWQNSILTRATALCTFLQENGLLADLHPFDDQGNIRQDVVIRTSNLSREGQALFDSAWLNWEHYLDRGGDAHNTSILEQGLRTIRATM